MISGVNRNDNESLCGRRVRTLYRNMLQLPSQCVSSLLEVQTEGEPLQMMGAKDN